MYPGREAVDRGLERRALRLGLFDQVDHLGDGVVGDARRGAHRQGAALDDRAREHVVARPLAGRHGLAGDRRLVDSGLPVDDGAVDRQPLAGQRPHEIAGADRRGGHGVGVVAVDDVGLGRRQRDQVANGAARAVHGQRLQKIAQREEKDDQARLAPLADGGRADHGDRHEDVHVDRAGAQRVPRRAGGESAAGDHCRGKQERRERRRQSLGDKAGGDRRTRDRGQHGAPRQERRALPTRRLAGRGPVVGVVTRLPALERVVAEPPHALEHLAEGDLVGVEHHLEGRRTEARGRADDAVGVLQGALELEGAVGAVETGDVRQALFVAVGARRVEDELAAALLVAVARAVRGAMRGGADASRVAREVVVAQQVVVEADVQQAARHVGRHLAHAAQASQPVAELLDALRALGAARQHDGQVERRGRHGRPAPSPVAPPFALPLALPVWPPWRTCSRVMSSSRRI